MSIREEIMGVVGELSDKRLRLLLRFAQHLALKDEREDWHSYGLHRLAEAYGADEPEYTLDDCIRRNDNWAADSQCEQHGKR